VASFVNGPLHSPVFECLLLEFQNSTAFSWNGVAVMEEDSGFLTEGATEFLWSGVKGGLVFAVLGTLGTLRRGGLPGLPLLAQAVLGLNRAATNQSTEPLRNIYSWIKVPLAVAFLGFWGGGYIGYSQWKLEKDQQRYWTEKAAQEGGG